MSALKTPTSPLIPIINHVVQPLKLGQHFENLDHKKDQHIEVLYKKIEQVHVEDHETSLFNWSNDKINELIYETHHHPEVSFDEDSLFVIAENVLQHATQIIDNVVLGSNVPVKEKNLKDNKFRSPVSTIKSIGCELSCNKAPGEEIAHQTTLSILHKLSNYKWEAKAVLTLAAFAYEFGDFWHLAKPLESDHLAKQFALLKDVPRLIETMKLENHRQEVIELSNLIKTTTKVIGTFDKFEKLSADYGVKDIPALPKVLNHLAVHVYWTISTIAALATKISILISDEPEKSHDLSPYVQKITTISNDLNKWLISCERQRDEAKAFNKLSRIFETRVEVLEIFKVLIFTEGNIVQQAIIDGSKNNLENIDKLRKKTLFLYFSTLDITGDDIALLKPVYEKTTENADENAIVWIPIVSEWDAESQKKFHNLSSEIPWYILRHFSPIAGIKYLKEKWQFKEKPQLVVISPQGKVENTNAIHLIKSWGLVLFPFNEQAQKKILDEINWPDLVFHDNLDIVTSINEEKYIFFYGGKDDELIQQFTKKVTILQHDSFFKDIIKINFDQFPVGKTAKGGEDSGIIAQFWDRIQSLFLIKAHKQDDPVTQDIEKLLSYKNDSAWAVLSKGSTVVIAGRGSIFLQVIEKVDKWKEFLKEKGFEATFKEQYHYIYEAQDTPRPCSHLNVPIVAGKVPDIIKCKECSLTMEISIAYSCCHGNGLNAHH